MGKGGEKEKVGIPLYFPQPWVAIFYLEKATVTFLKKVLGIICE